MNKDARGFENYCDLTTERGERVRVKESSAFGMNNCWLFLDCEVSYQPDACQRDVVGVGTCVQGNAAAHLSVAQAKQVRDALDQFIQSREHRASTCPACNGEGGGQVTSVGDFCQWCGRGKTF